MKSRYVSIVLSAGLVLGASLGCSAATEPQGDEGSASSPPAAPASLERAAETTLKLENAFSDQFVRGTIDRAALAPLADAVVQSAPEEGRPELQQHIEDVLQAGERAVAQLGPEERAQMAAPAPAERVGTQAQAMWGGWGGRGWGGGGAFGFPGWGGWGGGWGRGWGGGWGGWGGRGWGDFDHDWDDWGRRGWGGWGGGWGCGTWGGFCRW